MKPQLLKVSTSPTHSFSVRRDQVPHMNNRWHYHPELELIHFKKGFGTQFVGDSIENFEEGDVVLLGSNLPHYWRFDNSYFQDSKSQPADVRVVHFQEDFWGKTFLNLPENIGLRILFEKARLGLKISGPTKTFIADTLADMLESNGAERLFLLLKILNTLAGSADGSQISSKGINLNFAEEESMRMNAVYNFAINNFQRKITLDEVAEIAGLSSNSFCRYFKSRTGKTFTSFLIELRINHACRYLIENRMTVKQICFESGFYNFASFHKNFKEITKKSPLVFQREFLQKRLS